MGSIRRPEAFQQPELVPCAEPLDELAQVGALDLAPFLVQADDGVGGGGGVGVRRAWEAPTQHREDFLAIDHDGPYVAGKRGRRPLEPTVPTAGPSRATFAHVT